MDFDFRNEAVMWEERKRQIFHDINQSGLPLVLFGKSTAIDPAFLRKIHVPVQYIFDNDPQKWNSTLWGLTIIAPNEVEINYRAYNVLILVPFESQIIPQLKSLSVPPTKIFRLDLYFEENDSAQFFNNHQADVAEIYSLLSDQLSKDTFEATIRYRINRNVDYLKEISLPREDQYFPLALGDKKPFLGTDEIFVDAGAFVGDTVEAFCRSVNDSYRTIYAFEPTTVNYERLLSASSRLPNIHCKQVAVGEKKELIRFSIDDSSSKKDALGKQVIECDTLDLLLSDTPVTYIKMDVEGMECAALRGAEQLIQTRKPKLAICIYHSNEDMLAVPKLILKLNPEYHLYIRHYTNALVETVCYAI